MNKILNTNNKIKKNIINIKLDTETENDDINNVEYNSDNESDTETDYDSD